jgi:hypothetical protein
MTKRQKHRRPSAKQRALLAGIASGLTVTEAARRAGYAPSTSRGKVYEMLAKSAPFRAHVAKALERAGISDAKLFERLSEGLDATERKGFQRTKSIKVGTDKTGKPIAVPVNVYEVEDLVAWGERLHYVDVALRLKGYLGHEAPEEPEPEKQRRVKVEIVMGCDFCEHCRTGQKPPTPVGASSTAAWMP